MGFNVNYNSKIDCVVTEIEGDIDKKVVSDFFQAVGKTATENNCTRVLSDLRNAEIIAPLSDIYEMAKVIEEKGILKSFRRAIVISKNQVDYDFWKTVCHNQGHSVIKLFDNYDLAKEWILE